jgi:hypothetical protein
MTDEPDDDRPDDEPAPQPAAVDPERPKRVRNKRLREEQEAVAFWRGVFADPVGRREIWRAILGPEASHAFEQRHACGPNGFPQPEATWAALGEQLLGQRLYLTWLRLAPENVALMLSEHDPRFKPADGA